MTPARRLTAPHRGVAVHQHDIPRGLIQTFRALGGGWEIREGDPLVRPEVREAMQTRTNWGPLLTPGAVQRATDVPPSSRPVPAPDW